MGVIVKHQISTPPKPADFAKCEKLALVQGWNEMPEEGLLAGHASLLWSPTHIWVYAELEDHDVYHDAKTDNERMWELGDVFEIFWKEAEQSGYDEVHVTPHSRRMWLRFPSDHTINLIRVGEDHHSRYFVPVEGVTAEARISDSGWYALTGIPRTSSVGDKFALSLCRYDAHRDRDPHFASTTLHRVADFHRPQDWPMFELVDPAR